MPMYAAPRIYRVAAQAVFDFPTKIIQEDSAYYPNRSHTDHGEILIRINDRWDYSNYNIYNKNDWLEIKNAFEAGQKLKPRLFSEGYRKP